MKKTFPKRSSQNRRECLLVFFGILVVFSICSTFLIGCHAYPRDGERRVSVIPNVQTFEKKKQECPESELVLTVKNKVDRIVLSSNRKRLILETRREIPEEQDGMETQSDAPLGVELWNIEFADARQELFSNKDYCLAGTTPGLAAFDEKGERIFWLDQETNPIFLQSSQKDLRSSVIRGAAIDNAPSSEPNDSWVEESSLRPLPLYLPWEEDEEECVEKSSFVDAVPNDLATDEVQEEVGNVDISDQHLKINAENGKLRHSPETPITANEKRRELPDAVDNASAALKDQLPPQEELNNQPEHNDPVLATKFVNEEISDHPYVNVVMTKSLESDALLLLNPENNDSSGAEVKRLKTSLVTKNAEDVWLSSSSKWLVCHTANEGEEAPDSSVTFPSTEQQNADEVERYSLEWALVPVRDRKRIVRFPDTIKMTFDSSTSDEEIRGRIVDVLAVSDAEDLVATLVEELSQNPRYKIVVWDLNVALKVDLEKARTPLRAIEVSQIALPYPISKKYCKFSPSGKSIAARIDPHYVTVWQSTNGRLIVEIGEHLGVVHDFEFSPSETKMVVGTGDAAGQVFLWEIRKGVAFQILDNFPHVVKSIDAVAFSSNERFVYFANDQGEVRRWDIRPKIQTFD